MSRRWLIAMVFAAGAVLSGCDAADDDDTTGTGGTAATGTSGAGGDTAGTPGTGGESGTGGTGGGSDECDGTKIYKNGVLVHPGMESSATCVSCHGPSQPAAHGGQYDDGAPESCTVADCHGCQ